jgi:hypothetical protein
VLHQRVVNPAELFWNDAHAFMAQHLFDGLHGGSGR